MNKTTISPIQIGFDFDCVIADTAATFLQIICRKYGYCSYSLDDITSFNVENCIGIPRDLTLEIFASLEKNSLPIVPVEGAIEVLTELAQIGSPTIVTARHDTAPVYEWLEYYLPEKTSLEKFRIAASSDHDGKLKHIQKFDLKYFIDDRAETCEALAQTEITPIVFNRPWNLKRHNQMTVEGWQEIAQLLSLTTS